MADAKKTKTIDELMFEAMLPKAVREAAAMTLEARVEQLERFGTMMFEWNTKLEKRLNELPAHNWAAN